MIDRFGNRIDELDSVRAMIEFKYNNQTRKFYIAQLIVYILTNALPFIALRQIPRYSPHNNKLLTINLCGQVLFFTGECINFCEEGWKNYLTDSTNFFDYTQFMAFIAYYYFKKEDLFNGLDENNVDQD